MHTVCLHEGGYDCLSVHHKYNKTVLSYCISSVRFSFSLVHWVLSLQPEYQSLVIKKKKVLNGYAINVCCRYLQSLYTFSFMSSSH